MKYLLISLLLFLVSCHSEKADCLSKSDISKVKQNVQLLQEAFKNKEYNSIKKTIDTSKIEEYSFSRVTSLLNESLAAKEVTYVFKEDDKNCGSVVVDFLSFEIITDDEGEHRVESSVSLEYSVIEGELKITALGFAG
ncbi:hypothetical protein ABGT15_06540 [Flavobacterium enshiense]|uniref:hypothetical protein n=1 Tax=Flavobacterium enshiense TaxID=1341165 RepID=UPI00345CB552